MSAAGGVHRALERGAALGCLAVQLFTSNQRRWQAADLGREEIAAFRAGKTGLAAVLAHGSYLINLASPDQDVWRRSVAALAAELERCSKLGIDRLVLHPGYHLGSDCASAIARLIEGAARAMERAAVQPARLVFETTAGGGSALGGSFEQLRDILAAASARNLAAGICLDTCHVFAAGYELRHPEGYARTWELFASRLGLEQLEVLHLNDSKYPLASRKDRHEHIGLGQLGLAAFRLLSRDPYLHDVPAVLETPKGKTMKEDRRNLHLLRSLAAAAAGPGREAAGRL